MTMPETPNYHFVLIPDRFRGWGAFYRSAMTTIDSALKALSDRREINQMGDVPGLLEALGSKASAAGLEALRNELSNAIQVNIQQDQALAEIRQTNMVQTQQILDLYNQINSLRNQGGGGNSATITVGFTSAASGAGAASLFNATSASSEGAIVANEWSYGDGTMGSGVNVSHVYTSAGRYSVTLLARDSNGASKSVTSRHLVLPPFAPQLQPSNQAAYPATISYAAAQYTDPDVGPPRQTSPESIVEATFASTLPLGPFSPTSAKLRFVASSNSAPSPDNTQAAQTITVYARYGGGAEQLVGQTSGSNAYKGAIDTTLSLPAGFAGDVTVRFSPPRTDGYTMSISSVELLLDYAAEAASPSPMNQMLTWTPRVATRVFDAPNSIISGAGLAVAVGEAYTPSRGGVLQYRIRENATITYSNMRGPYSLTDSSNVAYMLPENATVTSAAIEGDVAIVASGGATGGGATLSATPSGGAGATHALVDGEHFSLPVNLASTKGAVDLALQPTAPNLDASGDGDFKVTVTNLTLRVGFTTP